MADNNTSSYVPSKELSFFSALAKAASGRKKELEQAEAQKNAADAAMLKAVLPTIIAQQGANKRAQIIAGTAQNQLAFDMEKESRSHQLAVDTLVQERTIALQKIQQAQEAGRDAKRLQLELREIDKKAEGEKYRFDQVMKIQATRERRMDSIADDMRQLGIDKNLADYKHNLSIKFLTKEAELGKYDKSLGQDPRLLPIRGRMRMLEEKLSMLNMAIQIPDPIWPTKAKDLMPIYTTAEAEYRTVLTEWDQAMSQIGKSPLIQPYIPAYKEVPKKENLLHKIIPGYEPGTEIKPVQPNVPSVISGPTQPYTLETLKEIGLPNIVVPQGVSKKELLDKIEEMSSSWSKSEIDDAWSEDESSLKAAGFSVDEVDSIKKYIYRNQ